MNVGYKAALLALADRGIDFIVIWGGAAGRRLKTAGFNLYIAGNMMVCAILFCFWSKPRETVSGFVGRKALLGSSIALYAARGIDKLHPHEPAHCGETALSEDEARFVLYPEEQVAGLETARPELNPRGV